jgi:hypothetical protein
MVLNYDECSDDGVSDTQLCLRQYLGMASEWLSIWILRVAGVVGLFITWKLWTGHKIVRTDKRRGATDMRMSLSFAYSSTRYDLLGFIGLALVFLFFIYLDGLQR